LVTLRRLDMTQKENTDGDWIMIKKIHKKKKADEICRALRGLNFSCKPVLVKKTIFTSGEAKYEIRTDAPEIIIRDISRGVYGP